MRWLFILSLTAAGVALGAAGLLFLRGEEPDELLPDLDQAAPSALSIVRSGDSYRITFLSAVDNLGSGPLILEASRPSRATPTMTTRQVVRSSDGSSRRIALGSELRYVKAETHAHWHVLGFERYELRRAEDEGPVGRDVKTGFCLGDRYDANADDRLPNEPPGAVWTEECGRGRPGLLRLTQGISPGYGDDYVPKLEGQYVDVTGLPAGRYLLVHRVNADRALRESDYGNNAASVLLALRRPTGDIPTITVLARCPESESCPAR